MENVKFLWESFKSFKTVGSIIRSGPQMCEKMTQFIDKDQHKVIVEYGAGDGAITKYILNKIAPDAKLFIFEINNNFIEKLVEIEDSRITVLNASGEDIKIQLEKFGIYKVDMIISAIPFLVLPESLTINILSESKDMLPSGGIFIQMHYSTKLKSLYEKIFDNITTYFVPINIPPGFVFKCVKE